MRCTQLCAQWAVQSGAVVVVGISQPRQCWTWGRALPHALLSPFSISAMRGPWCAPVAQPCCQRRAALPQGRIGCGWDKVQWGLILCPHPILGLPEPRTRTILLSCSESVRRGKSALLRLQECSAPSRGRCCSRGGAGGRHGPYLLCGSKWRWWLRGRVPCRGRQRWEGTPLPCRSAWDRQAAAMLSTCPDGDVSARTPNQPRGIPKKQRGTPQLTGMSRSRWFWLSSVASSLGASKGRRSSCTGRAATSGTGRSRTAYGP